MSDRAAAGDRAGRGRIGLGPDALLWPVLLGWTLVALPQLFAFAAFATDTSRLMSTDDAMRLVQVRDLLAGQGWFDLTQYRLGPGTGTQMHWTRVIDAPLAALIWLVRPLAGQPAAELAALLIWPLGLLLPALAAIGCAARKLGGTLAMWLATLLLALVLEQGTKFDLGSLDHHNAQLVLLVVAVALFAFVPGSWRAAAGLGLVLAADLGIGVELLPQVAMIALGTGLLWVAQGAPARAAAMAFSAGFAAALGLIFLATAPTPSYAPGLCDTLSRDVLLPALAGAAGLLAAAALASRLGPGARFLALLAAGAASLSVAVLVAPACLAPPLSDLDPFLRENWLDRVAETRTIGESLRDVPGFILPIVIAALTGLFAALVLAWRGGSARPLWLLTAALILASFGLTLWQLRASTALAPLAALPAAVLAAALFGHYRQTGRSAAGFAAIALFLGAATSPADNAFALLSREEDPAGDAVAGAAEPERLNCGSREALAVLAALPPGLVSGSSNMGPFILLNTPHRVLSAPYHRNQAGMIAQLRIALSESDAEAEARLRALGVDYVVACAADGEYKTRIEEGRTGFAFRLAEGRVPAFLVALPVPPATPSPRTGKPRVNPVVVYRFAAPAADPNANP